MPQELADDGPTADALWARATDETEEQPAGFPATKKRKKLKSSGERTTPAAPESSELAVMNEQAMVESGVADRQPKKKKKQQQVREKEEEPTEAIGKAPPALASVSPAPKAPKKAVKASSAPEADRMHSSLSDVLGADAEEAAAPSEARAFDSSSSQKKKEEKKSKKEGAQGARDFDKLIGTYASQRQLSNALRVFNKMKKVGVEPTLHTYGNVINAHVNSGDINGAYNVLDTIRSAGLQPNVIVYTALLKGYCRVGNIPDSAALLDDMVRQRPSVMPDMRAINTFLRGCLRVGDVAAAERVFGKSQHHWELTPDPGAYQFMGRLLSAGLRLGSLKNLQRQLATQSEKEAAAGTAGMGVSVRQASGLGAVECDFWKKGKCKRAAKCLFFHDPSFKPMTKGAGFAELERAAASAALCLDSARCLALLGKWKECKTSLSQAAEAEGKVAQLLDGTDAAVGAVTAQRVRHGEAKLEAELIGKFLAQRLTADFADCLSKTLIFSSKLIENEASDVSMEGTMVALVDAHLKTLGLDELSRLGICKPEDLERRFMAFMTPQAHIDWRGVFAPSGGSKRGSAEVSMDLPLKLEVGAGTGEWAVAQAKAEAGKANWAAAELMHDRAHGIFTRMVFNHVSNLCVMAGDAARILQQHIAPGSVAHVFSNFPEPPHLSGNEESDSSLHLLTDEFLRQVHVALAPGGRLTIFSDNERYCRTLAANLGKLRNSSGVELFRSLAGPSADGVEDTEDIAGVHLHRGVPGKQFGHAVNVSTRFDRQWEQNQRTDRFFIAVQRSEGASGSDQLELQKAAGAVSQKKKKVVKKPRAT